MRRTFVFIRSERLFLRPGWPEDWAEVAAAIDDDAVLCNLDRAPWPYRPESACASDAPRHPHFLVTLPGADGARLIGCAGFAARHDVAEIGVFTASAHTGHGFATEVVRNVLPLARTLGHRRIIASNFAHQAGWRRVLEKAGFRATGQVRERFNPVRGAAEPALIHAIDLAAPGNCDGPGDPEGLMRAA
jgi:RimJ/RimL family protein N-acetyltransferase